MNIPPPSPFISNLFNSNDYPQSINPTVLNYMNSNFLNLNGGIINGSVNFLNTMVLGTLTGTIITNTVPLNVVNYCSTNIPAMQTSGNPYTAGSTSYYINSSGVTSSLTSSSNFNYSGYFSGDCASNAFINFSDKRIKTNIIDLPESIVNDFIERVEPKLYNLKSNLDNDEFGFISQQLYKCGFKNIVQCVPDDSLEEEIDDDGFISPKGIKYTISYIKIIPILLKKIQMMNKEIKELKN